MIEIKRDRLLFGIFLVILFFYLPKDIYFPSQKSLTPITNPYPPPATPSIPQQGSNTIFLPVILKPQDRYYAQVQKDGQFYGVWATIETPNPVIREPYFSYASINIIGPDGKWIETGLDKGLYTDCIPKFIWAIQPGTLMVVLSPLPTVGMAYQYLIEKITDGQWSLQIITTSGYVIFNTNINNPGLNFGTKIQATGEVNSVSKLNDMGVAGLLYLKWKMANSNWSYWNGYTNGVVNFPPYQIVGVPPDPSNNVQISGNNGNPIPPDAPCP